MAFNDQIVAIDPYVSSRIAETSLNGVRLNSKRPALRRNVKQYRPLHRLYHHVPAFAVESDLLVQFEGSLGATIPLRFIGILSCRHLYKPRFYHEFDFLVLSLALILKLVLSPW